MSAIAAAPAAVRPVKSWLVGPWFDLLFLGNIAWPIAGLLAWRWLYTAPADVKPDEQMLSLFQVYFLSTPHRWITLVLVFCDSDRFWKEPAKFGGIGVGLVLGGLGLVVLAGLLPFASSSLMLLMMLDYVWNAWHFAAQHAGISRIYGRTARPEQALPHAEFEKSALRTLVLWVFLRFAVHVGSNSPFGDNVSWLGPWLHWLDPVAIIPAAILVFREVRAFRMQCVGRLVYISSVITLYVAQLVAIRFDDLPMMKALFFAGAIFHAVEYLAICNWSVQKRTTGIWQHQISRTGIALVAFMLVLGGVGYLVTEKSLYAWQLITLLVSLLHYAYDGIIWKAKPAPAKA